jgi:signal transduction histidine kinase
MAKHCLITPKKLAAFGLQAAASVENARLRLDQVLAATVAERTRLSRELHDSVLQSLFGMTLGLRTAREHIGKDDAAADSALDYSLRLAESAHSEMRSLVLELRPESLINEGLLTALRKQSETLLERHQIKLIANIAIDEPKCSIHEKEAIYRVVMEALNNVIKHSSSRTVHLMVMSNGRELIVTVSDDGIGFDVYQDYPGHVGLASMRERSTSVGAALEVTSALNSGTTVKVTLPLRRMA